MDANSVLQLVRRQQNKQDAARNSGNSASSVVSTLVPTILIAVAIFLAFLFLRTKMSRVYQPRSYNGIVAQQYRTPAPKPGLFGWMSDFRQLGDDHILRHQSLDGYFFVRYLKMLSIIAFVGCCVTWPVLFPVNATGGGGQSQLDIVSMSNVLNPNRYYAHALIAWVFFGFVLFVVTRESLYFIGVRQAVFMSTLHAQRLSSRTVLFLGVPDESLKEESLRQIFGRHVRRVWIVPDCKKLEDTIEDRDKLWGKFEQGQMKLVLNTNKEPPQNLNRENPLASIDKKSWPTHKLKPLIGKKVNTIEHGRTELPALNKKIRDAQNAHFDGHEKKASAAFVEFSSQAAAQEALQYTEKSKTKFSPRYIQVQPEQVIWKNLSMNKFSRKLKMAIATTAITLLTIFWAIPVAFVGILTNINYLTNKVPFLSFINSIPSVILGVVTGLLPVILLAVLMALVPIICRLLAKFAGAPTLAVVELKTQSWYFIFQVIQVFLITTFTSAASSVASQIVSDPTSAVSLLATNLPKASNFYISYFILQGLMIFALQLLNAAPLIMISLVSKFTDKTPRKLYNRWMQLVGIGWGSEYPKFTNMGVIMLSYSCIAPLVLGFATIGFGLMYLGFRYQFLFVLGLKVDMQGESYLKGLRQLLTGLYLATLCLIGLFAIAVADNRAALGPLILMIIFLVVLIASHILVVAGLRPLIDNIPLHLLADNQASRVLSADAAEHGHAYDSDDTRADGTTGHGSIARASYNKEDPNAQPIAAATNHARQHQTTQEPMEWSPSVSKSDRKPNFLTARFSKMINSTRAKAQARLAHDEIEKPAAYSAQDVQQAYLHPALAATREPIVWLASDAPERTEGLPGLGLTRALIEDSRKAGLHSVDDGAWLAIEEKKKGKRKVKVMWDSEGVEKVPIYEEHKMW